MKTLIIYKTKYGSTKQYAQWLHEDVEDADILDMKDFQHADLDTYDWIIIGSCVYMARISAGKFLKSHWKQLQQKNIYLFVVGNVPADSEESQQSFNLLPKDVRDGLQGYVKLPGKVDVDNMNVLMRTLLKLFGAAKSEDKMDRNALKPIIHVLEQQKPV